MLWNRSVGVHLPAATTAIGRVLISALRPDAAHEWLETVEIKRFTERTLTSSAAIENVLRHVRTKGYAIVDQELENGLRSLGVPIKNKSGDTIAGLSVSVIDGKINGAALVKRYLEPLRDASREISMSLPA